MVEAARETGGRLSGGLTGRFDRAVECALVYYIFINLVFGGVFRHDSIF